METGKAKIVVTRPGQVVALDTTPLPVKVLDDVFGTPITVHLTLALDVYSHSLVAFRLTPVSEASVEVAMLLRDVMLPLPMRQDWGEEVEWPYPGVPAALVAEFAGHKVAGLPFFAPETVTSDHGSVYKNHHIVAVARRLGIDLLPARAMRPTDKAACERAFAGIQSLLLEMLLGYRGVDVADRGADPEGDAVWSLSQMEHLLATWIVSVWQNRRLDQYAPAWDPGGRHSPNTLFAAAAARDGISLEIPEPESYFELLPTHYVKIDRQRGVKIGGLWYGGADPVLDPYRGQRSGRSGQHAGKWAMGRDPRDCRQVFFENPGQPGHWHALDWNGLPPGDDVPAFGDARVRELLGEAVRAGLKPLDDRELPLPRAQEHLWPPPQSSPYAPPRRNPQIHATRWIRSYYDELDTWSYFELDNESWALRHVDLQGPTLQPVTAAALSEVLGIRDQRDQTAMADYEHKYGILAEGSLDGWQDTQSATEITAAEFERIWAAAREALAPDGG
ncbi:DDE-type integrase/transposase/recombinase [Streptomyces sp. CC77]|uniref:DDE-type integrase/transposase/recombinase n=1 Tax=Streptomyces sp. CC77 TaxID=1906739 RepID=UPI00091017F5|nr:DDE-type integrase/transposase/recombinase [Streptomyces sp. CC77]OII66686.1 hypothetical protein BJP39_08095 [Streptomyces sp. CC77]